VRSPREIISDTFTVVAIALGVSCLIPAAVIINWTLDRTPPLDLVQGRFDGWESESPPVVRVRWTGVRQRICLGESTGFAFTDRVFPLDKKSLPMSSAKEYMGKGQVVWVESVPLNQDILDTEEKSLFLTRRFSWECNPLQQYWPIVVDAPRVNIPLPEQIPSP
jgi:hypothetical protein